MKKELPVARRGEFCCPVRPKAALLFCVGFIKNPPPCGGGSVFGSTYVKSGTQGSRGSLMFQQT